MQYPLSGDHVTVQVPLALLAPGANQRSLLRTILNAYGLFGACPDRPLNRAITKQRTCKKQSLNVTKGLKLDTETCLFGSGLIGIGISTFIVVSATALVVDGLRVPLLGVLRPRYGTGRNNLCCDRLGVDVCLNDVT